MSIDLFNLLPLAGVLMVAVALTLGIRQVNRWLDARQSSTDYRDYRDDEAWADYLWDLRSK